MTGFEPRTSDVGSDHFLLSHNHYPRTGYFVMSSGEPLIGDLESGRSPKTNIERLPKVSE